METSESIQIQYSITVKDLIHARKVSLRYKPFRNALTLGFLLLISGGNIYLIYNWVRDLIMSFSGLLAYLLISFFISYIILWNSTSGFYALHFWITLKQNRELYMDPRVISFDHTGIHAKTSVSEGRIDWSFHHYALEDEQFFLILRSRDMYAPVPKSAFSSEEQIQAFRELLEQKLGPIHSIKASKLARYLGF